MTVRTCFVANPRSGRHSWQDAVRALADEAGATWWETSGPDSGAELAQRARAAGCERIVVVGGDGTMRNVVAGLGPHARCSVALVPSGTGNDLSRSLAIPIDPVAATQLALTGATRRIDLISAVGSDGVEHIGVNMAVAGLAGTLGQRVSPETKEQFGALAYLGQALRDLPSLAPYAVRADTDEGLVEELEVIGGVVANGRTAGGGYRAAPGANLEDGKLDLVLVRNMTALELAGLAARLAAGDSRQDASVRYVTSAVVQIHAEPAMPFNLDGDPLCDTPIRFTCLPGALEIVVGPDYVVQPG